VNKDNMNTGVQILLERMDTNPEEFIEGGYSKWNDIVNAVHARKNTPEAHKNTAPLPFLTEPEVNALYEKLEDVRRENFTADVLRRLADTPKEQTQDDLFDSAKYTLATNNPFKGTTLTKTLTNGTTGTWGTSSISHAQTLSLGDKQKEELVRALNEYRTEEKKKAIPR
jgi:hypothetical protein